MKVKVYSSQYSNLYGNNQIHFPYSIATLVSYCIEEKEIQENYDFKQVFLFKDGVESDIEKAKDANILLCSCYSWNWEVTKHLARNVKANNPSCLIVFGGPEVPRIHSGFFDENPFVDIIVHGEGEVTLCDILRSYVKDGGIDLTKFKISGAETKLCKTMPRARIEDLNKIPSPYSSDLIWKLAEKNPAINYIVSWETNRGCPFSCTYCDWGSSTMSKVRNFDDEKIFKEIEWFGRNNITYIDCCDGNFGIFQERDYNIAKKLVESKQKTGFPERLNLTWVKTSSEKVIPTAKLLADAQMLRAVSLSVQSLDQKTLDAIKRKNLKFDKFEDLINKFADQGIQSYTELIMGLPEETVDSFKNNWEILASIQPQPAIMVWNCSVFVNAPMNEPAYIKKYGIEVFTSPMFMSHSANKEGEIKEYEKMVRATNTLPEGKISEVYLFNWIMMAFHVFGIGEFLSRYYNKKHGVPYSKFYDTLTEYCKTSDGLFAQEFAKAVKKAEEGYSGKGWDFRDEELGEISWPVEEACWLKMVRNKDAVRAELAKFIQYAAKQLGIASVEQEEKDLIEFQMLVLNFPVERTSESVEMNLGYDWLSYFHNKEAKEPQAKPVVLSKTVKIKEQDIIKWGYEAVWFGRRAHKYKMKLKELNEQRS